MDNQRSPRKGKRFDISIKQAPRDKYTSGVEDYFRDTWTPKRSVNARHYGDRPVFDDDVEERLHVADYEG